MIRSTGSRAVCCGKRGADSRAVSRAIDQPVVDYGSNVAAVGAKYSVVFDAANDLSGSAVDLATCNLQRAPVLCVQIHLISESFALMAVGTF